MIRKRSLFALVLFALVLFAAREGEAVIYRYVNEKGVPTFADDLQKIPEKHRASAVMVSGTIVDEAAAADKAKLAADTRARMEQQAASPARAEEPLSRRLIRSGIAVAVFAAILFVLSNIHGLKEQAQVLTRIRAGLVVLLVLFLGFTHAKDITGLFGMAGEKITSPISGIQERSAERGKKAADAYKAFDRVLDQRAQDEEARAKEMDRKFEEAEKAR